MTALASGQQGKYFDDAQAAFSPQGVAEGNGILGHLFGSKDLSRAVTAQAAQATGIGQSVLNQMLPVLASMVMGGLFKQSTNQMQGAQAGGFGGANNPLGQIIEQMMKQGGGGMFGGQPQQQQAPSNPMDNPLGKILEGMFGGGAAQQPRAPSSSHLPTRWTILSARCWKTCLAARNSSRRRSRSTVNPMGDNPWGKIFEDMMRGGQAQTPAEPDEEPAPHRARRAAVQPIPTTTFSARCSRAAAKPATTIRRASKSIFDQFTRGMDRNR